MSRNLTMQGWCIVRRGRDLAPTVIGILKRSPMQSSILSHASRTSAAFPRRDPLLLRSFTSRIRAVSDASRSVTSLSAADGSNSSSARFANLQSRSSAHSATDGEANLSSASVDSVAGSQQLNAAVSSAAATQSSATDHSRSSGLTPSRVARALGYAGLVPFAGGALGCAYGFGIDTDVALRVTQLYGASILSFLGAIHWGLALSHCRSGPGRPSSSSISRDFVFSVLPSLAGWGASLAEPRVGLALLTPAFIGTLLYDMKRLSPGLQVVPDWFLPLRKRLTLGAAASMLFAVFMTMPRPLATIEVERTPVVSV